MQKTLLRLPPIVGERNKTENDILDKEKKKNKGYSESHVSKGSTTIKYKIATLFFIGVMCSGTGFAILFPYSFQNIIANVSINAILS